MKEKKTVLSLLFLLLLVPLNTHAQTFLLPSLSDQQYVILATDIRGPHQAEFAAAVAGNDDASIAAAYNAQATPLFYAWRAKVSRLEILFGVSEEGTSFTWTTNGFLTRTLQEIEAWRELFSRGDDSTSPGQANVQAALLTIFSGAAGTDAQKNRVHIASIARRPATRAEVLFMLSGTGTKADPGVKGWEGLLRPIDVAHALRGAPLS